MNKDLDERLLPDGMVRHAENVLIINSEGSDIGSIQNSYSNKKLTNFNFGDNPKCQLGFADEKEDKLYWFVLSDLGCYLVEWDNVNEILSIVLGDTRPVGGGRVLDLKENYLITGIEKVTSEDKKQTLLTWTDDNMQPCCVNIERAKTYGINGFEKEDIYLIKKPPRKAPTVIPILQNTQSNNMEEKFLLFATRFKYLDGEYSALSDFTNYKFTPKDFDLDFFTLDNIGMVNRYNAIKLLFDTGDKRVTDIQLVFKESNSNTIFLVETFNKEKEGWGHNQIKNHIFSNNKVYTILPEKELYRSFDNVPLKAKAMTIIGNMIIFGNYLEGFDMVDDEGRKTVIDYSLSLVNEDISTGSEFTMAFPTDNTAEVSNPDDFQFNIGNTIDLYLNIFIAENEIYNNSFSLVLENDYDNLADFVASEEFETFMTIINSDYVSNYNSDGNYDVPDGWVVTVETEIQYDIVGSNLVFTVTPITFEDTTDGNAEHVIDTSFFNTTAMSVTEDSNAESCKTNRDYEVGFVYEEEFNRRCTVQTAASNTIYIPQKYSIFKNRIRVTINHKAPYWADRYKIVVKSKPLQYQTLYVNEYYNDDFYVYCLLVADNKDKIKVGDELIIKRAANQVITTPIKVKILEIKEQEKGFITGNNDQNGNPIEEPAGLYMKINPNGFSMDFNDYKVYQTSQKMGSPGYPGLYMNLFSQVVVDNPFPTPDVIEDIPITSGSSIYIHINSGRGYDDYWQNIPYDKTYYAKRDYATLEEWFLENFIGKNLFAKEEAGGMAVRNYKDNVQLLRGFVTYNSWGVPHFTSNSGGKLYLFVKGLLSGGSKDRSGYLDVTIRIRTSVGVYVFETNPKQAESEIFYETEQVFDIIDGNHMANNQNQDLDASIPAVVDLDFFNCYTQGNGVESYRVKDAFNKDYLNIDSRPSTTSVEEYKAIRRKSDLTYGGAFIESSNMNGLNEFNASTANFKELDKQYGSIQKLHSRDNDLVVFQEEKTSKVLFQKNALYGSDGSIDVTATKDVLGQQITYLGENGIGRNPESFGVNDFQIFYANPLRGVVQRLSIDGVTDVVNGMVDFFRDLFIQKPNAKKIGCFDPYHKQYFLSVNEEPVRIYNLECGNTIVKSNVSAPFSYNFNINDLVGDIVLNYNITGGNATITATYDGNFYVDSNVTGLGTITIPRTDVTEKLVVVQVAPVAEDIIGFEISNICPLGIPMKVVSIVLNDSVDIDATIINRYRWTGSSFYSENDVFDDTPITRFSEEIGVEGQGRFPNRGTVVNLQSFKDAGSTGHFKLSECNRLGYLVSNVVYTPADLATILSSATFITVTETVDGFSNELNQGNFLFNRTADDEILYLIWDYTNRAPIAVDDYTSTQKGTSKNIEVLDNDSDPDGLPLTVTIITPPINGIAVVETDNTITYTHNNTDTYEDTIVYSVSNGNCSTQATVHIDIAVACDDSFSYNGNQGTFSFPISFGTAIGSCGISYNAFSIPDQFEIYWNGNLVASSGGMVSGTGTLTFNKTSATPTLATVVVTATNDGTAWSIAGICPNVSPLLRQEFLAGKIAEDEFSE